MNPHSTNPGIRLVTGPIKNKLSWNFEVVLACWPGRLGFALAKKNAKCVTFDFDSQSEAFFLVLTLLDVDLTLRSTCSKHAKYGKNDFAPVHLDLMALGLSSICSKYAKYVETIFE
jgi:hypothetical protein